MIGHIISHWLVTMACLSGTVPKSTVDFVEWDPDISAGHIPPDMSSGHSPSFFTWCKTFPPTTTTVRQSI